MNILLINPRGSNFYAKTWLHLPPLGLAYIAAVLRTKGHVVKISDLGIKGNSLTSDNLNWAQIVGISADTPGYPEVLAIAKMARDSGKKVVMGGYHVTFLDREALDTGLPDFIVRGEGEEIMLNLLNTLEKDGNLNEVDGISYLNEGIYCRNKDTPPPANLDKLPLPARDLLTMQEYRCIMNGWSFTSLITSRGCPYNCHFCSSSKFGGLRWRARSARSIVDEIEYLYTTYNIKAFSFMDDNFTLSPERVFEFADELDRRALKDIHWCCFSRVDIVARNEEMIRRMSESGAYMIFLGLESNNHTVLESYNKNIGNNHQQRAIELLNKYGIKIHASYIIGDIKETREMVENTIRWAKRVNAKTTQFSILTPYPGTELYDKVNKHNRFLHKNWKLYDGLHPAIKMDYLNPKQMSKLLIKAYQRVYLNLAFLINLSSGLLKKTGNKAESKSIIEKFKIIFETFSLLATLLFKLRKSST